MDREWVCVCVCEFPFKNSLSPIEFRVCVYPNRVYKCTVTAPTAAQAAKHQQELKTKQTKTFYYNDDN